LDNIFSTEREFSCKQKRFTGLYFGQFFLNSSGHVVWSFHFYGVFNSHVAKESGATSFVKLEEAAVLGVHEDDHGDDDALREVVVLESILF
jgi:hypothetical protein